MPISSRTILARVRAAGPPPGTVVLDFGLVIQVDVTGAQALPSVHDTLDARGIRLIVAPARSTLRDALRRSGTVDVLGDRNLVPSVDGAVDAREPAHAAMPIRRRANHPKRRMRRTDAPVDTACSR